MPLFKQLRITRQSTASTLSRAGTGNGLLGADMYAMVQSDFTLSAALGVQTAFPAAIDVWTLEANTTYEFWGLYDMSTGATAHSIGMAFLAGGSLTFSSIKYQAWGANTVANTTQAAQGMAPITTAALTVVTASAATAGNHIMFRGSMRINAGGTLTPQIAFSANPTGTNLMLEGSYIAFRPLGSGTFTSIGSVA